MADVVGPAGFKGRAELPSEEMALSLIHALLANATELVGDARLLLGERRPPRAYALAVLAIEELGKTYPCLLIMLGDPSLTARAFWAGWRRRAEKIDSAWAYHTAFLAVLEAIDFSRLGEVPVEMGSVKMRGFYVDLVDQGIQAPAAIDTVARREDGRPRWRHGRARPCRL